MRPGDMKSISHADDVLLDNESVWSRFHSVGTEMIITKHGRRMFPWCRFRLNGLEPKRRYFLLMDIVPMDDLRHRWNGETWEEDGPGEPHIQSLPCFHPESPAAGQRWMDGPVSFYKVMLTFDTVDQDSCVALRPMHRYQPRLYVVPVSAGHQGPVSVEGPEVQTFTFPKTEFYAVTSIQNPKINQLKVDCNPFMLALREDGEKELRLAVSDRRQSQSTISDNHDENSEHLMKRFTCDQEGSPMSSEAHRLSRCQTSDHSSRNNTSFTSQQKSEDLTASRRSAAGKARGVYCRSKKSRKAKSKWWSNVKYARNAVDFRPAKDVAMQPDLEDVNGMLFVSFGVKEALDGHVANMNRSVEPSSSSLTHSQTDNSPCDEEVLSSLEEIISHQEHILLQHLKKQKKRQIIHPALQNVGLKLNLLDPAVPIDLHYLGVCLSSSAGSVNNHPTFSDVPFALRTKKTNDLNVKGLQRNSNFSCEQRSVNSSVNQSAFFSDDLEEYLESEAQQIHRRADAFFTSSQSPVVYQLPDKSSSYVRTLDSVLQTRHLTPAHPMPHSSAGHHNLPAVITRSNSTTPETVSKRLKPKIIQRSPQDHHPTSASNAVSKHKAEVRGLGRLSLCSSIGVRWSTPAKMQTKLSAHEQEAVYHGKSRTCVTTERAKCALTSLLTSQKSKKSAFSKYSVDEDVCGNDFCRLGCVCESLNRKVRGPTHCRRPQCMFDCDCFKHKVFLIRPSENIRKKPLIAFSVADPEFNRRPDPATNVSSLWNRRSDDNDTELIFTPTAVPVPQKNTRLRVYVPRPNPVILEMEKDPVYRYLESKMTCARVREYNSNPPPQFYIFPVQKTKSGCELSAHRHLMSSSPDKNPTASGLNTGEPEPTKVLEIISECNWEAYRTLVLKELFRSISMDLLSSYLLIDIYRVDLLSKTLTNDEGCCTLNYKVCVSLSETSRQIDEPKNKDTKCKSFKEQIHVNNATHQQVYKSSDKQSNDEIHIKNVDKGTPKPFPLLSRVVTAGCLKASLKTSTCDRSIQVNGKTYSQAKVLLGQMGSLHPANRLAAYVTGRMKPTPPDENRRSSSLITPLKVSNPAPPSDSVSVPNLSSTPDCITSSNPRLVPIFVPPAKQACPRFVPAKPSIILPPAALPPGQQVVLQPIAGVSGANICQFNGQMIQLFPLPAVLPIHLQTKGNTRQEPLKTSFLLPQMVQSTVNPQEPASSQTAFPKPLISLPGMASFSFTGGTTGQGLKKDFASKAGTISFRICPPTDDQTEKPSEAGDGASTILLPGGYKLMRLPGVESVNTANNKPPSAFTPLHPINKRTIKSRQECESFSACNEYPKDKCEKLAGLCDVMPEMTLRNGCDLSSRNSIQETENDSVLESDVEQKDQIAWCPKVDNTTHETKRMSPRHVEVTNEGMMRNESLVIPHIKIEPCEIPAESPFTGDPHLPEHDLMLKDDPRAFIKIEPYDSHGSFSKHHEQEPSCSSTPCPGHIPTNTDAVICTHPYNTEESNDDLEDSFVVIKIETCDETSDKNKFPDCGAISENTINPASKYSSSICPKTEPTENNSQALKTEETGDEPICREVFKHPVGVQDGCDDPAQIIRSSLNDAQQYSGDGKAQICSWPFRLMQKAMNSGEEDAEDSSVDREASCDDEMSSSMDDSGNMWKCFSDDWTTEDSNEDDINIETFEENMEHMNICQLWAQARRTLKKAEPNELELRNESDGFQVGVEHQSDLCVYKRAWHLNQSARKRKRCNESKQYFHLLRRILNVEENDVTVQDVLHQACHMIESLEHRSRSLTEKKKSLIQKRSNYISLISQLSGSALRHDAQNNTAETASHGHSVTQRPLGLPQIVLRAFRDV